MSSENLERDIFGGSDSELSSEEDNRVARARKTAGSQEGSPREGSTGGEDYANREGSKKLKFKKKKSTAAQGEDGDSGIKPAKRKKKKRARSPEPDAEEPPAEELDPEQRRRLELNQQIDSIVKPSKSRPKKRKKDDDETLDRFADEAVQRLRGEMVMAAAADSQANTDKQPATAKLRLLPEVMDILQKQSYMQSIFDHNLLDAVRIWLEPLPDKSLPALNIQNALFEALLKMDIETSVLKESGLGRIILFYTRCKRVTPGIKRSADNLVEVWSRPIIKRSSSYRDREIPTAAIDTSNNKPQKLSAILARAKESEQGRSRKNAVRIPERDLNTYMVAPKSNISASQNQAEQEKKRAQMERLRKMQRKLVINSQKSARL